jgi:hypothetical protein
MSLIERYEQGEPFGDLLAEADAEVERLRALHAKDYTELVQHAEAAEQLKGAVGALMPYLRHASPNCTPSGTDTEDRCVCGLTATLRRLQGGQ